MFYARGAVPAASAADACGSSVAVPLIGARGGRRIPPAHAAGASAASEQSGGNDAWHDSRLCPLRAIDGLPGCAAGFVVGAFRTPAGSRAALPLPGLRLRMWGSFGFV